MAPLVRYASVVLIAFASLNSCSEGLGPLSGASAPAAVTVEAVRVDAIRLSWNSVPEEDVIGYAIERRSDLTGPFLPVVNQIPQSGLERMSWLDTDVDPETYYGYRIFAVTRLGNRSIASVIGGTKTPPLPGIEVNTATILPSADAVDPDGYELTITGPDTVHTTIGVAQRRRFTPLRPGRYDVKLSGIIPRCALENSATQSIDVTDTTAVTITPVSFRVSCRDPKRGEIRVTVAATGRDFDPEYTVALLGEAADATLPDAERIVSQQKTLAFVDPTTSFPNLRPGTYDITLQGIAPNCEVQGAVKRTVQVSALGTANVSYAVTCTGPEEPPLEPGFHYNTTWVDLGGGQIAVDLRIDMRTFNRTDITDVTTGANIGDPLTGVQLSFTYDASKLTFVEGIGTSSPNITAAPVVNGNDPGTVVILNGGTSLVTGNVGIARIIFNRVSGATGTVRTTTTLINVASRKGSTTVNITADVRNTEGTYILGSGGGGGSTNQPPTARANGPYSKAVNSPVTFSSSGSTDPDGTIASYSWNFGDNSSGTGQTPSHTYTTAGTYTVTLTVTDNAGATDTDQATITVSAPSDTRPLIWRMVFGPVDMVNDMVSITVSYDLRTNISETPGSEVLQSFVVDSLKWDASLLQFSSINLGPNVTGSSSQANVSAGNLGFRGTVSGAQAQGLITIATIRFKIVGAGGARATTSTFLGNLQGAVSTNSFIYNSKTRVIEGEIVLP